MSLALSRKASPTASPTLTSFATTRPARSRAWIAIGTTPPSTPSWRALCREIPSKDGIGQTFEESGAARRPARPHGPHDPRERGAVPEGDGEGVQDRIAGIHLRDGGIGWRERGPEEPAERVDEARGSTRATLPRQNRPQGHDLSRALRRGAHHRPLQRTPAPADPSGAGGARGRKHLYSHAERRTPGNDQGAARPCPEIFRSGGRSHGGWRQGTEHRTPEAFV